MTQFERINRIVFNKVRFAWFKITRGKRVNAAGIQLISLRAQISSDNNATVQIGQRCQIEDGTLIRAGGNGSLTLGSRVFINRNCTIVSRSAISIGNGTTIGPNVCIYDHDHNYKSGTGFIEKPISIGKNVWLGAGVTILKGCNIGDNVVVGAGTIITKDVPDNSVVYTHRDIRIKTKEQ